MQWGNRFLARRAHALVFNSRYQRDIWQRALGFPAERAHIVENFYGGKVSGNNLPPEKKLFVSAGRNIKLKNTPRLLEAFARVKKDFPEIELDTKSLPPEENAARLKRCYAVIASTISDMNPNLVIEGVAVGKPFLAPQESGASERLTGLGIFIDTSETDALERGIRELLRPDVYARYADAIAHSSLAHSWSEIAQEYADIAKRI